MKGQKSQVQKNSEKKNTGESQWMSRMKINTQQLHKLPVDIVFASALPLFLLVVSPCRVVFKSITLTCKYTVFFWDYDAQI